MSILSDDYYKRKLEQSQQQRVPVITPQVSQPQQPQQQVGGPLKQFEELTAEPAERQLVAPYYPNEQGRVSITPNLSQENQIKQYGGVVGSQQYYDYKAKNPDYLQGFAESLGMKFPDDETWDRLDSFQKTSFLYPSFMIGLGSMFTRLPRASLQAVGMVGKTIAEPIVQTLQGKEPTAESLGAEPIQSIPWIGEIPTIYQVEKQARDAGMGPIMSKVAAFGNYMGSALMTAGIGEAAVSLFKPRVQVKGTPVYDTKPIEQVLVKTGPTSYKIMKPGANAVGEYYSVPKTVAKKYGGSSQNVFFKVAPSTIDNTGIALSLVKIGKGKGAIEGAFGPETHLVSQSLKLGDRVAPKMFHGSQVTIDQIAEQGFKPGKNSVFGEGAFFTDSKKTAATFGDGSNTITLNPEKFNLKSFSSVAEEQAFIAEQGVKNLSEAIQKEGKYDGFKLSHPDESVGTTYGITNINKLNVEIKNVYQNTALSSLLDKPLKGFENKPITNEQVTHLSQIMEVNKIEPEMAQSVMRVVTGKDNVGSLTQTEYVNTSKALAAFNDVGRYLGKDSMVNVFSQYLSPQRWWMRDIENRIGVPLYSKVYVPMENAFRARNVFRDSYRVQAREIFGKYKNPGNFENRRLVKAYMEGDTGAIIDNQTLTTQVKSDLVKIATDLRPLYDKLGQIFDIPTEVFLKDYQPHIQNLGGVYQLYKQGAELPTELSFFAEFKRNGSLSTQVDDALALFDIYVNAGSNKMFLNPALAESVPEIAKMPQTLQNSAKSYVTEKLGYAGRTDQWVNEISSSLAKKTGIDLPNDVARQMSKYIMDTTYAGALGARPDAILRNLFQYFLMAYPRLGPKFSGQAIKKAMTSEGIKEVKDRGFLVELGVPYGAELLKEAETAGGIGAFYQKGTQLILKPYGAADTFTRTATYWQGKYVWEDALTKYSEGKYTYDQFEAAADFNALNIADRNIIRNLMKDKKSEQAFEHYIRDVIDETQFPYRRGASSRIFYAEGSTLGQFGQWNVEFAHTFSNWVKTGQWDKVIRFGAMSTAAERTIDETFGIDISKWVGANVVSPTLSPIMQFADEFVSLMGNVKSNDMQKAIEDLDNIQRSLFSIGIPGGVELNKIRNFNRSIDLSKKYNLPPGEYGVYSSSGKLMYITDFKGIFWGMFGLGSMEGKTASDVQKQLKNEQFLYSQRKKEVLELYQQEKYDIANQMISQYGIQLTQQDFQSYYIPLNQRTYRSLPASLKAQFAPLIFK